MRHLSKAKQNREWRRETKGSEGTGLGFDRGRRQTERSESESNRHLEKNTML